MKFLLGIILFAMIPLSTWQHVIPLPKDENAALVEATSDIRVAKHAEKHQWFAAGTPESLNRDASGEIASVKPNRWDVKETYNVRSKLEISQLRTDSLAHCFGKSLDVSSLEPPFDYQLAVLLTVVTPYAESYRIIREELVKVLLDLDFDNAKDINELHASMSTLTATFLQAVTSANQTMPSDRLTMWGKVLKSNDVEQNIQSYEDCLTNLQNLLPLLEREVSNADASSKDISAAHREQWRVYNQTKQAYAACWISCKRRKATMNAQYAHLSTLELDVSRTTAKAHTQRELFEKFKQLTDRHQKYIAFVKARSASNEKQHTLFYNFFASFQHLYNTLAASPEFEQRSERLIRQLSSVSTTVKRLNILHVILKQNYSIVPFNESLLTNNNLQAFNVKIHELKLFFERSQVTTSSIITSQTTTEQYSTLSGPEPDYDQAAESSGISGATSTVTRSDVERTNHIPIEQEIISTTFPSEPNQDISHDAEAQLPSTKAGYGHEQGIDEYTEISIISSTVHAGYGSKMEQSTSKYDWSDYDDIDRAPITIALAVVDETGSATTAMTDAESDRENSTFSLPRTGNPTEQSFTEEMLWDYDSDYNLLTTSVPQSRHRMEDATTTLHLGNGAVTVAPEDAREPDETTTVEHDRNYSHDLTESTTVRPSNEPDIAPSTTAPTEGDGRIEDRSTIQQNWDPTGYDIILTSPVPDEVDDSASSTTVVPDGDDETNTIDQEWYYTVDEVLLTTPVPDEVDDSASSTTVVPDGDDETNTIDQEWYYTVDGVLITAPEPDEVDGSASSTTVTSEEEGSEDDSSMLMQTGGSDEEETTVIVQEDDESLKRETSYWQDRIFSRVAESDGAGNIAGVMGEQAEKLSDYVIDEQAYS